MENAYGIGVKNRYELFYDEDVDPLEIIRQQEEEKEKRKTDKAHSKDKSKVAKPGKQISATVPKKAPKETPVGTLPKPTEPTEKPRTRPFDRSSKPPRNFEDSKDVEERKNFRNREDHQPAGFETRERDSEPRRGRGGFRGRGRSRGRGGFFNNFEGRPRREFDRHSGSDKTGSRPVDKRDGGGSNNWGDTKSETSRREPETWMDEEFDGTPSDKNPDSSWKDSLIENEIQSPNREEAVQEKNSEDVATDNMDSKENEPVTEERMEESVKEMTLDEWKREQEAKRVVPKYNLRKPGEGEDGNQWKKLYMLKKKANEEDEDDDEEEEDVDDEEFARRGRHRQLVDIQINFNDSRRGRGRGRGVRGIGPRSGGLAGNKDAPRSERRDEGTSSNVVGRSFARGSSKSKSGQQSAPRVDDWNDFPSLVTV